MKYPRPNWDSALLDWPTNENAELMRVNGYVTLCTGGLRSRRRTRYRRSWVTSKGGARFTLLEGTETGSGTLLGSTSGHAVTSSRQWVEKKPSSARTFETRSRAPGFAGGYLLHARLEDIRHLRNSIAHHEPILTSHNPLYAGHRKHLARAHTHECLGWISTNTSNSLEHRSRFQLAVGVQPIGLRS